MNKEQREFIVRKLAAFETPDDIAKLFAVIWKGTACTSDDVTRTDPRTNIVDPNLHALFLSERERVLDDLSLAPMAEQRARLIVLSKQAERYQNNNQPAEARAVLRQIAEEQGVVGGKAGKPTAADTLPNIGSIEVTHTIVDPQQPGPT